MQDPFLMRRGEATELFIVRHGDAIPDSDEIIPSGIYDDLPLSSLGREQAQNLAERLGSLHFDSIYSSPLRRCQETAEPLARRLELTPILVPAIKEIRLGNIRPLPEHGADLSVLAQALKERQTDIVRIAGETGHWDAIPNSEPSKDFRQRVVTALDEIAHNHVGERVIAFAHGGVVNAYAAEVLGLERDFFFPAANTSITMVKVSGKHRVLYILNDFAHIKRHA
jgi:2,3-bisphosphoglycerate-dependent phosphoglycerate mutase